MRLLLRLRSDGLGRRAPGTWSWGFLKWGYPCISSMKSCDFSSVNPACFWGFPFYSHIINESIPIMVIFLMIGWWFFEWWFMVTNLVGGCIPTPPKNMSSSIGMISNPIFLGKCQKWQPNHQPVMVFPMVRLVSWCGNFRPRLSCLELSGFRLVPSTGTRGSFRDPRHGEAVDSIDCQLELLVSETRLCSIESGVMEVKMMIDVQDSQNRTL